MTLRGLPSVHELVEHIGAGGARLPHALVVSEARAAVEAAREAILGGREIDEPLERTLERRLAEWLRPSQRRVVNATGVVLHTNLGRAPLAAFEVPYGYTNLEYDLAAGRRGRRDAHAGKLLETILGKPAIVVNNNAAALFLVLNELAAGGEAIISRGELIEIGDGFRIPEIMERSGAALREVGTTNRTSIADYREAIGEGTRVILRVHPSNFRMTGFTARPRLEELVELGRERGIPVYEDLGSGCVVDLRTYGIDEPLAQASLAAGANLISFSGDKLLGGPQAGIVAGDRDLVARVRRNPLFRAFRQDKLAYAALEATLRNIALGQYDSIPALRMIRLGAKEIRERATRMAGHIARAGSFEPGFEPAVEPGKSVIGGGATPDIALATWLIAIADGNPNRLERKLRENDPPILARIEQGRVVLDLRTVFPEDEERIVEAFS